ncbi:MAG: hypothetical protein WCA84_19965 [Ignavibacteriaceae bacterium]
MKRQEKKLNVGFKNGGSTTIICGNRQKEITLEKEQTIRLNW